MDKPVRQHITELQRRVKQLSQEMMQNRNTRTERNRLEAELRLAQQALAQYQEQYQQFTVGEKAVMESKELSRLVLELRPTLLKCVEARKNRDAKHKLRAAW
jgi:hypothetical protein